MPEKDDSKQMAWKVLLWAIAVFVSLNTAIFGYVITELHNVDVRLSRIESSSVSSSDVNNLLGALHQLETQVAKIPKEIPPQWLREKVRGLEERVRDNEIKLWRCEEKLKSIPK